MDNNKKQRKSTRSFNMEKHVERHFEIEKEGVPVADTPIEKSDSVIAGSSIGEDTSTSNNRGKLIAVIVAVLAFLAFVAYRSCGSSQENESEPTNTIVSDSTEKTDTASNVKKATAPETEQEQNNVGENTDESPATPISSANPAKANDNQVAERPAKRNSTTIAEHAKTAQSKPAATQTTKPFSATSAPISGDVEENARRVIRGDFGNGQERRDKLGSSYSEIQGKVNEMYRQGLVH